MHQILQETDDIRNFLNTYLENFSNVLLVTGEKSFSTFDEELNLFEIVESKVGLKITKKGSNNHFEEIKDQITQMNNFEFDAIISIGGGSVMDFAKLILFFISQGDDFQELPFEEIIEIKKKLINIPHLAIPTTCGSGSEATHFAVIYYNNVKFSVSHPDLIPSNVCLSHQLVESLPRKVLASSILDALCQSLEGYWSVNSTVLSRNYSLISLSILQNEIRRISNSDNIINHGLFLYAAYYAGKSINIAKTTASHALSYKIAEIYHLNHGHAVSLTIVELFKLNYNRAQEHDMKLYQRLDRILEILSINNPEELRIFISTLYEFADLQSKQELLKFNEHSEMIVNSVNQQRLKNNPIHLEYSDLHDILAS